MLAVYLLLLPVVQACFCPSAGSSCGCSRGYGGGYSYGGGGYAGYQSYGSSYSAYPSYYGSYQQPQQSYAVAVSQPAAPFYAAQPGLYAQAPAPQYFPVSSGPAVPTVAQQRVITVSEPAYPTPEVIYPQQVPVSASVIETTEPSKQLTRIVPIKKNGGNNDDFEYYYVYSDDNDKPKGTKRDRKRHQGEVKQAKPSEVTLDEYDFDDHHEQPKVLLGGHKQIGDVETTTPLAVLPVRTTESPVTKFDDGDYIEEVSVLATLPANIIPTVPPVPTTPELETDAPTTQDFVTESSGTSTEAPETFETEAPETFNTEPQQTFETEPPTTTPTTTTTTSTATTTLGTTTEPPLETITFESIPVDPTPATVAPMSSKLELPMNSTEYEYEDYEIEEITFLNEKGELETVTKIITTTKSPIETNKLEETKHVVEHRSAEDEQGDLDAAYKARVFGVRNLGDLVTDRRTA